MISEETILDKVEDVLNNKLSVRQFNDMFNEFILENDKSKYNIIVRLIKSFSDLILNKSNGYDFFVNLRQFINTYKKRVKVSKFISDKFKELNKINLYLELIEESKDKFVINSVKAKVPELNDEEVLNDFGKIYIKNRYKSKGATGDLRLKRMTGFKEYKSSCQKLIIRALEKQKFGTTVLATMKTGGGKSLLIQYVSKYEKKGTTIVVLPTVALTMDQEESSKKFFEEQDRKVYAYYEGVDKDKKQKIFNDLLKGKVAILYISPESILNGLFYEKIIKCAEMKILDRIVIDEAHLVADWGESFRTEFQFLSVFRRKILEITKGRLKTLLISATITEKSQKILRKLYSEENNFIEIRGDSLREEISFYKIKCKNDIERIKKIKDIIVTIPKPIILYVPTIDHSNQYFELLKSLGCERLAVFTSNTSSKDRKDILDKWNEDKIDIMIATSAFGMGVDKKEVRSVIHTFIPENIDRFYQEVGRGGRDGYKSYSFVFTSKEDSDYINYFTSSKVLSAEKIISRWNEMIKKPYEKISGDEYWLSTNIVPEYLFDSAFTGKQSENWNEYVILFLYRNNFLDILDIKINMIDRSRLLHIKLKDLDLINNQKDFEKVINELRKDDREYIEKDIQNILEMIKLNKTCWGRKIKKSYEYTSYKCYGCPFCREHNKKTVKSEDYFEIAEGEDIFRKSFNEHINRDEKLFIIEDKNIYNYIDQIAQICKTNDIDNLILFDKNMTDFFINSNVDLDSYLYTYEEAKEDIDFVVGAVAIVMIAGNNDNNDMIFRRYKKKYSNGKLKKLIFISEKNVYIKSETRNIELCIDNISYVRS
ncbi:DEAD/DEAH box helicase [Clostridium sp. HCS.1]|uniref:DEAD/DEAH box helicase n=1 Tax=Clostridium sp. HCS.1 TaxID=3238594 RepID=UPI003A100F08